MALCLFSLPDSSVSSQNLVFSYDGCQEEGSCMFLKKGGYQERGMKKERGMGGGMEISSCNMGVKCSSQLQSQQVFCISWLLSFNFPAYISFLSPVFSPWTLQEEIFQKTQHIVLLHNDNPLTLHNESAKSMQQISRKRQKNHFEKYNKIFCTN